MAGVKAVTEQPVCGDCRALAERYLVAYREAELCTTNFVTAPLPGRAFNLVADQRDRARQWRHDQARECLELCRRERHVALRGQLVLFGRAT